MAYAVKNSTCKGRPNAEPLDKLRTPFQVDRDRVLHSKPFRRLKDKTQVFTPSSGAHFRDRLTHTLEVSQIARSLARNLGVNEDLAEVIALAHDLGHTPFGHAGEDVLNECMQKHGLDYEHNEQSRQIAESLNLTFETLEGLQKHQTPYDQVNNRFVAATIEAQIVNVADEIAYYCHDLDDGLRSKILHLKQVSKLDLWQMAKQDLDIKADRQKIISNLMKLLIQDLLTQSANNINGVNSLDDVYNSKTVLVSFSKEIKSKIKILREFLYQNFYMSPKVKEQTSHGGKIIESLFDFYYNNPTELPAKYATKIANNQNRVMIIKDYISGMTDSYARFKFKAHALS